MPRLDEVIFSFPEVVDYRAEKNGESILLTVLTTKTADAHLVASAVEAAFPDLQVTVSAKKVSPQDTTLYRGKRVLLPS